MKTKVSQRAWVLTRAALALLLLSSLVFSGWTQQFVIGQSDSNVRFTDSLEFIEVAPGIEHGKILRGNNSPDEATGPWFINVLRIDLKRTTLKIVHALDEGVGLETVSSMAARHRAVAAVNGGYFRTTGTFRGEANGFLFLEGKLISEPFNNRAEVGFITTDSATEVIFGHLKFSGNLSLGSASHSVNGLNRPLSANELIVFTPEFHRTTLTNPEGIEVVVRRGKVAAVADMKGSTQIPRDGYVISAVGSARDWVKRHVHKGAIAKYSWQFNSSDSRNDSRWRRAQSILGAGPQLIKAGKVAITHVEEKMAPGFATDRHPRTAIAVLNSGKLVLVTVDGRQPGVSVGMSLFALAALLLELGAAEAINLDGGGSTTMVLLNKVVNRPSDQTGERPVSDAILVFSKRN